MGKIVFTGPESTGKTTLSEWFSVYAGYRLVPEYARTYLVDTNDQSKLPNDHSITLKFTIKDKIISYN